MTNTPLEPADNKPLLPPAEWPGLLSYYVVWNDQQTNAAPELRTGFMLDASRYELPAQAAADLEVYAGIFEQLRNIIDEAAELEMVLSTSLLQEEIMLSPVQCAVIVDLIKAVCVYLNDKVNSSNKQLPPGEVALVFPVEQAKLNSKDIFELNVQLVIRQKCIDGTDLSPVSESYISLPVEWPSFSNDTGIDTVIDFAVAFEKAFDLTGAQIKIAVTDTGNPWAVRWASKEDSQIWYDIQNSPCYFAVQPLANTAVSREAVPVYSYETGNGLASEPVSRSFTSTDMDEWGRSFVDALELVVSSYAVQASIAGKLEGKAIDYIQLLYDAKKDIAAAVALNLSSVFAEQQPTATQLQQAIDDMREACLKDLRNAYAVDMIVSLPAKVSSQYKRDDKEIAALCGNVDAVLAGDDELSAEQFSLEAAKLLLVESTEDNPQWFTLKLSAEHIVSRDGLAVDVIYSPAQIDVTCYENENSSSSGLQFIIPPAQKKLGKISIPLLLRASPAPPSIGSQRINQKENIAGIASAKLWDCEFDYSCDHRVQDIIDFRVAFNDSRFESNREARTTQPDLFAALAQFATVYQQVMADLETFLSQVAMETKGTDYHYVKGLIALKAFVSCTQQVAAAWKTWKAGTNMPVQEEKIISALQITVQEMNDHGNAAMKISSVAVLPEEIKMPVVNVDPDNYQVIDSDVASILHYEKKNDPDKGQLLRYNAARLKKNRTLLLADLDVLRSRKARASLSVTRNASFQGLTTNDAFIYRTGYSAFSAAAVPFPDHEMAIDVTGQQYGTLAQHLASMFKAILCTSSFEKEIMNIGCTYSYKLNGLFDTKLPLFVAANTEFYLPGDYELPQAGCNGSSEEKICMMATHIRQWFATYKPDTTDAVFIFDITIFSKEDTAMMPLLRLRNLQLPLLRISDLTVN